jgi:hypothetical protein
MAFVDFSIDSVSEKSSWTGRFEVSSLTDVVKSTLPTKVITYVGEGDEPEEFEFVPTKVKNFPTDYTHSYITWRSQESDLQFPKPQTGVSLDIWSIDLYTDVITNDFTWQDLIDNCSLYGGYSLATDKWSVYYNYNVPYGVNYSRGGNIALTVGS